MIPRATQVYQDITSYSKRVSRHGHILSRVTRAAAEFGASGHTLCGQLLDAT
jgi:hypothetical protein